MKSKSKWKTLRCVVEYRTPDQSMSERDLAQRVQYLMDQNHKDFPASKPWAKPFNSVLALMKAARPRKLFAATKQLEAVVARLRKL